MSDQPAHEAIVSPSKLDAIAIESNHTIAVDSFVLRGQIDERYHYEEAVVEMPRKKQAGIPERRRNQRRDRRMSSISWMRCGEAADLVRQAVPRGAHSAL